MTLSTDVLLAATGCDRQGADMLAACLDVAMRKHAINTPLRQAHFLAQTAFESGLYTRYVENLNYSAERLVVVFPKYFGPGKHDPAQYAHRQDAIANVVYASRMGNGPTESGDGWRYRGRGWLQLTGRANYEALAQAEAIMCVTLPELLTTAEYAALSAAWYWNAHDCSASADANFVSAVTQKINGGLNGLAERTALTMKALDAFGITRSTT